MTAFFEIDHNNSEPWRRRDTLSTYFEDDMVALDTTREYSSGRASYHELMLDRAEVSALIAALTNMQTIIAILHPQPQLEAPAVAA